MSSVDYCASLLKARDYEHYVATLFIPRTFRNDVFAIRAFNVETSLVQNQVSIKATGEGRIYFWRDVIKKIYSEEVLSEVHPVVTALASSIRRCQLTKRWFLDIVDARSHQIENPNGFLTTESLEQYSDNTQSSLLRLILETCRMKDIHLDHAASHLGKAGGLITCLRAVAPLALMQHQVDFPMDILNTHSLSQQDIIHGRDTQKLRDAAYDLASLAHLHLKHSNEILLQQTKNNKLTRRVFLPRITYEKFLRLIQKCDFNLFDKRLHIRNRLLPMQFVFALLRR